MECNGTNEGSKRTLSHQINILDDLCGLCFESGHVAVREELPYGQAMQCRHDDGTEHIWTRYKSLASVGQRKKGKPTRIRCPQCRKMGMVNYYRPDVDRTDRVNYVIRHERIKGTWGKAKIRKVRRCYISGKEGKAQVRNILDRKKN